MENHKEELISFRSQLECWNTGMLEKWVKKKMTQCVIDKIATGNNAIKWIPSFSNPTFQYSTIPLFHDKGISRRWRAWSFDRHFDGFLHLNGGRRAFQSPPA
jgi:hypothetical protein